jgi:hypothetical protein
VLERSREGVALNASPAPEARLIEFVQLCAGERERGVEVGRRSVRRLVELLGIGAPPGGDVIGGARQDAREHVGGAVPTQREDGLRVGGEERRRGPAILGVALGDIRARVGLDADDHVALCQHASTRGSAKVSAFMTWHQWHQPACTLMSSSFRVLRASAKASGVHSRKSGAVP